MKKKIFAIIPVIALMVGMFSASAFAAEYEGDGTATCTISALVESSYTVSIPATLSLAKDTDGGFKGTYTVAAKGNIAPNQYVEISPETSVTLTGASTGETVTAYIAQAIQEWWNDEDSGHTQIDMTDYSSTTGVVTANLVKADNYEGSLVFTYSLKTVTSQP